MTTSEAKVNPLTDQALSKLYLGFSNKDQFILEGVIALLNKASLSIVRLSESEVETFVKHLPTSDFSQLHSAVLLEENLLGTSITLQQKRELMTQIAITYPSINFIFLWRNRLSDNSLTDLPMNCQECNSLINLMELVQGSSIR